MVGGAQDGWLMFVNNVVIQVNTWWAGLRMVG